MPNVDETDCRTAVSGTPKKLLQAAALAAALVPLGSINSEAATITVFCTAEVGCSGAVGSYSAGVNTTQIWGFFEDGGFDDDELLYTLEITGTPVNGFDLDVDSRHVSTTNIEEYSLPPGVACIPLVDAGTCVIFDVFAYPDAVWNEDGYYIEMRWFAPEGPTPMRPPNDDRNRIYKSENGYSFSERLDLDAFYDPLPSGDPEDPALGGRGDTFTSFIAGRQSVPEPATVLLFGAGMAAALVRRRRR